MKAVCNGESANPAKKCLIWKNSTLLKWFCPLTNFLFSLFFAFFRFFCQEIAIFLNEHVPRITKIIFLIFFTFKPHKHIELELALGGLCVHFRVVFPCPLVRKLGTLNSEVYFA